jgi:hypothetical protein
MANRDDEDDRPRRRDQDDDDDHDDRPRRRRHREEGDVTGGLIPYKNGMALAAYYCGVFSLIPCVWGVLSILAIIFGILGLSRAKEHPEAKGKAHAITGIVLGSITLLLAIAATVFFVVTAAKTR